MSVYLSKRTAQKIVDTVKDVCGYDINFINPKGIIFASTDFSRIGDFHEIGKRVIEKQETIEVTSDDSFYGTHKGVNIPFIYNRELIAAIGISGEPGEVRQYAMLAQKITSLILREQEIDSFNYGKKNRMNYLIRTLTEGNDIDFELAKDLLSDLGQSVEDIYRVVLVELNSHYNPSNLSMIENQIYRAFEVIKNPIYTFQYPNQYILLMPENQYHKWEYVFKNLSEKYRQILSVGVGSCNSLWKQNISFQSACTAIASLTEESSFACFDELELEIILGCVNGAAREEYLQKMIGKFGREEITLLKTYFDENMSLKDTAEKLFIHKNTLQYKLKRIYDISGFDPRCFRDAVKLYLAVRLA